MTPRNPLTQRSVTSPRNRRRPPQGKPTSQDAAIGRQGGGGYFPPDPLSMLPTDIELSIEDARRLWPGAEFAQDSRTGKR
jgi:hypothetical protein